MQSQTRFLTSSWGPNKQCRYKRVLLQENVAIGEVYGKSEKKNISRQKAVLQP